MMDIFALLRGKVYVICCRYLRKNINIGSGLKIYKKLKINGNGKVYIGNNCVVSGIIGDNSQYTCVDSYDPITIVSIGENVHLYAARIAAKYHITIGNDVLIEEAGIIDTDFHSIHKSREDPADENPERCRITIGNRVSIGARSIVLKGVTIGDDAIIAPGSVVAASVKPGSTVCGNPARPLSANAAHLSAE